MLSTILKNFSIQQIMETVINEISNISSWKSYEEFIPKLREIIATDDFKAFPKLRNEYYIEALAYYGLENWNHMPLHAKALIISRYPIFINKVALGKTIEEYNKEKSEISDSMSSMGLPICPVLDIPVKELSNTIPKWQYFTFFSEGTAETALSLEECKEIANNDNKGLIRFFLTYNLSEELFPSIVVYNQTSRVNRLVDSSTINRSKLIRETEPKKSDKEFDIVIDKDDCYVCLDYGLVGAFTICKYVVHKKDVLENRCLYCCSNDFIMENIKLSFMNDYNKRIVNTSKTIQDELKYVGDLINERWDDDKNRFVENIQDLKQNDYPLYLYLYWIKNDDTIHNKYQAFNYAQRWVR